MLEMILLSVFALALFLICVIAGQSILYALAFGLVLFFGYGLYKRYSFASVMHMAATGVKTIKTILFTFALIGMITAVWRACGTIPYIVFHAAKAVAPWSALLVTFLLCCLMSVLTGTAFGTAATIGVICATMAKGMGVPVVLTGGAVLAGSFFGDRCSPMSTSALLVSALTGTDIYHNISNMIKTSIVPFCVSCLVYLALGLRVHGSAVDTGVQAVFSGAFVLSPACLIPAAAIVLLSVFKVNVKLAMGVSIVCGSAVAVFVQKIAPTELIKIALLGFHPAEPELSSLLSGGGIISMVRVFFIILLSSCYAGIFQGTGFLDGIRGWLRRLSEKLLPFGSILLTALLTSMLSCNQTLAIMLTQQLCADIQPSPERLATDLSNSAVVVAALIPWSIAAAVPLTTVSAPLASIAAACFLYLLPLWNMIMSVAEHRKISSNGRCSHA